MRCLNCCFSLYIQFYWIIVMLSCKHNIDHWLLRHFNLKYWEKHTNSLRAKLSLWKYLFFSSAISFAYSILDFFLQSEEVLSDHSLFPYAVLCEAAVCIYIGRTSNQFNVFARVRIYLHLIIAENSIYFLFSSSAVLNIFIHGTWLLIHLNCSIYVSTVLYIA